MIRTLGRMFAVATVVAGIVGALRHRRESRSVRRGELPPASAAADVECRSVQGPVAQFLSQWVPDAPATPVARRLADVWTAPFTVLGFAVALAGGRMPRHDEHLDCWVVRGVGGPSRRALQWIGADANTIGRVVVCTGDTPSPALLAHESVHVRQFERLGPLMVPAYLWLAARHGYRDHPLERAARLGARRATRTGPDHSSG